MKSVVVSAISLSFLVLSVGCSNPSQQQANIGPDSTGIIGGKVPTSQEPITKSIVALRGAEDKMVFCSGSLITPRLVLTAAHCVLMGPQDQSIEVSFHSIGFHPQVEARKVKAAIAHDKFAQVDEKFAEEVSNKYPGDLASTILLQDDIALLLLESDAPAGFTPITLPSKALTKADIPALGAISGYGRTLSKITGIENLGQIPTIVLEIYKMIGTAGILTTLETGLTTDYKGVDTLGMTKKILSVSLPEKTGCQGDSGGPMTILQNGKLVQLGIASHLVTDDEEAVKTCSVAAVAYTDVTAYSAWIAEKSAELLKQK